MCYMDKPEDGEGKLNLPVHSLISAPRIYIKNKDGECRIEFQPRNVLYYY